MKKHELDSLDNFAKSFERILDTLVKIKTLVDGVLGKGVVLGKAMPFTAAGEVRKRAVILCPVPNCKKPGGGPKWGWFCIEHKKLSPEEKLAARKATRRRRYYDRSKDTESLRSVSPKSAVTIGPKM